MAVLTASQLVDKVKAVANTAAYKLLELSEIKHLVVKTVGLLWFVKRNLMGLS